MKDKLKIAALILFSPLILLIVLIMIPVALIANIIDKPFKRRRLKRLKDDISTNWLPNKKYLYLRYHSNSKLAPFLDAEIKKYGEHIIALRWNEDKNNWDDSTWKDLNEKSDKTLFGDIHSDPDDIFEAMIAYIDPETKEFSENALEIFPTEPGKYAIENIENKVSKAEAEATIAMFVERSLKLWR